ncbi:MAG: hypothetical protein U0P45_08815 [Acidimicrobiales bacterium]
MSDNDDWDDEPAKDAKAKEPAPSRRSSAKPSADDDWDDDWDDEAPRSGKRDMTLIYAVVAATIVIVLAIVLTNNKDSNSGSSNNANQGTNNATETTVKKDLVWQGPVVEAVGDVDKRIAAETGVFIWTDFDGWHVRNTTKDPVRVNVTADAIVLKDANGKPTGATKTEVSETVAPGDGSSGLDLDLQFSNSATFGLTANGAAVPPDQVKLGGAKGVADQNPITFNKA